MTSARILVPVLVLWFYSCKTEKPTIKIEEGQIGIVGYGSLMSLKSFESTLGRTYTDSVYQVHISGFRRKWDFVERADSLYGAYALYGSDTIRIQRSYSLNVVEAKGSKLNCLLYIISLSDLPLFDLREAGYTRIDITDAIEGYSFRDGRVFTYKALPGNVGYKPELDLLVDAIDKSYVELVLNACDSIGIDFRKEFDATTDQFDSLLLKEIIWK